MKKLLIVFLMAILANNSFAQSNDVDYSLEGLAKACAYYDEISSFHDGRSKVKKDGKWGFINKRGELVIPCKEYWSIGNFSNGFARIEWIEEIGDSGCKKSGYIDINGNMVIDLNTKYDDIEDFHEGLALITVNAKHGFINEKGQEVISCKYGFARGFSEGLAAVNLHSKIYDESPDLAYINTRGTVVLNPKGYSEINDFHNGLARVRERQGYGYIDKSGRQVIPCTYEEAEDFSEGLALVEIMTDEGDSYYYINNRGDKVLKFSDRISPKREEGFHEGLAIVKVKEHDKYAYLNTSFDYVFYYFEEAWSFSEGLALVKKNGKFGFIDKNGKSTFDY